MEIHVKKVITTEYTWQSMSQAYSLWSTQLAAFLSFSLPVGPRQQSNKLKEQKTWNIIGEVKMAAETLKVQAEDWIL